MAQLPTIASTASRRLMPSADLRIEGGSPDAFGAAVGRGVEALGSAGQDVAKALHQFELAKAQEAEQAEEFDRQATFVEFGTAESERLDNAAREISGPALDFTKTFMGDFDARQKAFLEKVPERRRDQWRAKFAALRGQVAGAALKTEFGQRDAWSTDKLNTSLTSLQNGAAQSPGKLDDYRRQGQELIASSLLSAQDKAERLTNWNANVAVAAATGDVQLDPVGALRRLGGAPHEEPPPGDSGDGPAPTSTPVRVPNVQHLLNSLISVESNGRVGVAGPATQYGTAHGLTQVLDSTGKEVAKKLGIEWLPGLMRDKGPAGAEYQKKIGLAYLQEGLNKYNGDARKALMFYHGGPDAKKWGPKTRAYAAEVLSRLPRGAAVTVQQAAAPAPATPAGVSPVAPDPLAPLPDAPTELPSIDPRYADLPLSARMQLIGAAQREIEKNEQEAEAAEQEDHQTRLNQLLLDLNDGKAGQADIEAAREAGWLTDYSEVERAESIVDARQKGDANLSNFHTMMNTPGFAFNQFDNDQQKAVDAGFAKAVEIDAKNGGHAGQFAIAMTMWQRTGILPKQGAVALRGALASTNPQSVAGAASVASNMLERNPNAFAGVEGGEEIEKGAMLYRHYVADLGKSPEEATRLMAKHNAPEAKRKIEANAETEKKFKADLRKHSVQVDKWLSNELGGWFVSDPEFTAPAQREAVRQDFAEIAWEHFAENGDMNAARSYAAQQVKKLYGAVNGRLMKYPPTRAYPSVNGSWDYLFAQAADDIKQVTGRKIDPKNVYLMPLPTATAEAFRAGRPTPYAVHYTEEVDGQTVYRALHGKAFIGDVGEARRLNAEGFQEARRKAVERGKRPPAPRRGRDY